MGQDQKVLDWTAVVVGALGALRVLAFVFLDKRPHFGGAEDGDLGVSMRNLRRALLPMSRTGQAHRRPARQ